MHKMFIFCIFNPPNDKEITNRTKVVTLSCDIS